MEIDDIIQLSEVVTDYLTASEDQNESLKNLKQKQFKEMYIKMFVESENKYLKDEQTKMSKKQKAKYENDLDKMSDLTL